MKKQKTPPKRESKNNKLINLFHNCNQNISLTLLWKSSETQAFITVKHSNQNYLPPYDEHRSLLAVLITPTILSKTWHIQCTSFKPQILSAEWAGVATPFSEQTGSWYHSIEKEKLNKNKPAHTEF